jgi:hypothetical protein
MEALKFAREAILKQYPRSPPGFIFYPPLIKT